MDAHDRNRERAENPHRALVLVADADGAREPIGDRIVVTSIDIERTELRDTRFGFVA